MFRTSVFAPRLGTSLPTGATALEVQQDANHHSRYDVSQRKRRNVPQEVFHGVPPFSGGAPHKNAAYTVSLLKARKCANTPPAWAWCLLCLVPDRSVYASKQTTCKCAVTASDCLTALLFLQGATVSLVKDGFGVQEEEEAVNVSPSSFSSYLFPVPSVRIFALI